MIDGFKIDLTSEELRKRFEDRAQYHRDKFEFYSRQVAQLTAGGVEQNQNVSNDPIGSLRQSAKHHSDKAELFTFFARHVVPNETYRISEHDLLRLELLGAM